jgi:predicted nucleotidyltransferase
MRTDPTDELQRLAELYARLLAKHLGRRLVSVVLYGSVARGDATANSDIDLLIVAQHLPRGHFARKRLLQSADLAFERALRRVEKAGIETRLARIVRTPKEAERIVPLYLDMTEDAVLLFDRGRFFAKVLDRVRASLYRLGSRRVRMGKTWYWDLKPDFEPGDVIEI